MVVAIGTRRYASSILKIIKRAAQAIGTIRASIAWRQAFGTRPIQIVKSDRTRLQTLGIVVNERRIARSTSSGRINTSQTRNTANHTGI